jgi:hypothetical protein
MLRRPKVVLAERESDGDGEEGVDEKERKEGRDGKKK